MMASSNPISMTQPFNQPGSGGQSAVQSSALARSSIDATSGMMNRDGRNDNLTNPKSMPPIRDRVAQPPGGFSYDVADDPVDESKFDDPLANVDPSMGFNSAPTMKGLDVTYSANPPNDAPRGGQDGQLQPMVPIKPPIARTVWENAGVAKVDLQANTSLEKDYYYTTYDAAISGLWKQVAQSSDPQAIKGAQNMMTRSQYKGKYDGLDFATRYYQGDRMPTDRGDPYAIFKFYMDKINDKLRMLDTGKVKVTAGNNPIGKVANQGRLNARTAHTKERYDELNFLAPLSKKSRKSSGVTVAMPGEMDLRISMDRLGLGSSATMEIQQNVQAFDQRAQALADAKAILTGQTTLPVGFGEESTGTDF